MLEIIQLPVLKDNYIYLLHEPSLNKTAVVDPAVSQPVLNTLKQKGWTLNYILNTHHHNDHIGANSDLQIATNCKIIAAKADNYRIPNIDIPVKEGDIFSLGKENITVIETPGHTLGHIVFYLENSKNLFCGDTLFSMGCGRLFEGSAEQMWNSLQKIKALPKETRIYCAHEYTQANGAFALTLEPDNKALQQRIQQVHQFRKDNKPTIPTSIELELMTNPFLRENTAVIQQSLNMKNKPLQKIFSKIRKLKDDF